jgi:hypothetical protein
MAQQDLMSPKVFAADSYMAKSNDHWDICLFYQSDLKFLQIQERQGFPQFNELWVANGK